MLFYCWVSACQLFFFFSPGSKEIYKPIFLLWGDIWIYSKDMFDSKENASENAGNILTKEESKSIGNLVEMFLFASFLMCLQLSISIVTDI